MDVIADNKILTSDDPKVAKLIKHASDHILRTRSGLFRMLKEYDEKYDTVNKKRPDRV